MAHFLVDASLPRATADLIRSLGHQAACACGLRERGRPAGKGGLAKRLQAAGKLQ